MTNDELKKIIQRYGGYIEVRELPDGSFAALGDLIYTRAIYLGCNAEGYSRRFCFSDRTRANTEFAALTSEDDEPSGWIARR
ncbi:hypothetical protein CCO03_08530 [Comamonas serinivorans]|uniref:Uncharacterized protein n=1 Tax=Comamonas serinivorans TaxID=1082851 RepID=A0A1Y0EM26_9BURK|nr:hypothetical protein [Comamonas serinivorans]ARU04714.1 hypothetical protein CCO03_08530 [Comamonas serinivorans]